MAIREYAAVQGSRERVSLLSMAPIGEAPGLGKVFKSGPHPCQECGADRYAFCDYMSGVEVARPECERCPGRHTIHRGPRFRRVDFDQPPQPDWRSPFVPLGFCSVDPGLWLQGVDWAAAFRRHAACDFGQVGSYAAGAPTSAEVFAPQLARLVVKNRVAVESLSGFVRSRFTDPAGTLDVMTCLSPGDPAATFLMRPEPDAPCFGVRLD